jgi:hypothetical protein
MTINKDYKLGYSRGYQIGNRDRGDRWTQSFLSARMLIGYDIKRMLEFEYTNKYSKENDMFKRGYLQAIADIEKSRFCKTQIPAESSESSTQPTEESP